MSLSINQIEAAITVLLARQNAGAGRKLRLKVEIERIEVELDLLATMVAELIEQKRRAEEANPCN